MIKQIIVCVLLACLSTGVMIAEDSAHAAKTFEGTLKTGIFAIGGETTGMLLETKNGGKIELDFGKNADLAKLAEKLNGKAVVVTGELVILESPETKERKALVVQSLKKAK